MNATTEALGAPEWTMADAYGDIGSERYEASFKKAQALVERLTSSSGAVAPDRTEILARLSDFDEATTLISSLAAFVKCTGAKDSEDERVARENSRLSALGSKLSFAGDPLFAAIDALEENDPLWTQKPLCDWRFVVRERAAHWKRRLTSAEREWLGDFEARCFMPLGDVFKTLQKGVDFEAENGRGEKERIKAAKLVSVIKGAPDRVLRRSVAKGLAESYGKRAELYAALLNNLHGFRLAAFKRAGVDALDVSLAQNRMSREALEAMRSAILSKIDVIRDAVRLRAPYFEGSGADRLAVFDLMAPAPAKEAVPALIPYAEGIGTVKAALGAVSPEMSGFIDMMLEKRWIDAKPSDRKIGGAFYSRFNEFKMPRVFSSYMGTITTVIQQGHELGHAFHYWTIRDLPVVQTEFPMTLTETASTFNEALIRRYLLAHSAQNDGGFSILWQELRSAANFLMNTMVRMDFELAFLREREKGVVSAKRCVELMRKAWHDWYGDSTEGADDYLWAYKLHYYKTDQLIYNYPYTVGYLLSEGLLAELDRRGDKFMDFYRGLLRSTGCATVDDIVRDHYGADAADPAFWLNCMTVPLESIAAFRAKFADPKNAGL